jgi:WhiB family redox-sensing transcriptional regulator
VTFGSGAMAWAAREEWQAEALCKEVGPNMFFAEEKGEKTVVNLAKSICNGSVDRAPCPVRDACLSWALEINDRWAVLGGLSPRQRQKYATELRRANGTLGQRTCQICQVAFAGTPNHRHCGRDCADEARRRRDRLRPKRVA